VPSVGVIYDTLWTLSTAGVRKDTMGFARSENEIADRVSEFLKTRITEAELTYADLAKELRKHGHPSETAESVKQKLKRGTFSATFLLATLAALGLEGVRLEDV